MILALETSCDDTAAALLDLDGKVILSRIASQIDFHKAFGGVVPEIASRQHLKVLPLLVKHLLEESQTSLKDLTAIAVTQAPGLIGSVLVGVSYAKAMAWSLDIPLVPVDHLEGHLLAPFLDHPDLEFPYLALIASGGHTHLLLAQGLGDYELLGKTLDDALGEAYDKTAKMLGFPYPGGPLIEQLAEHCPNPGIAFPIPLKGKKTLNFSFSGLKTAVRNQAIKWEILVEKKELIDYHRFIQEVNKEKLLLIADVAASFQQVVEKIVSQRIQQALKQFPVQRIVLTGGVAANQGLRRVLNELAEKKGAGFFAPSPHYCTDNAAMIGYTAHCYLKASPQGYPLDLFMNAASKSPLSRLESKE